MKKGRRMDDINSDESGVKLRVAPSRLATSNAPQVQKAGGSAKAGKSRN